MVVSRKNSAWQRILAKCRRTIQSYGLLARGDSVVVGVSGGVDSMVLLHLLDELRTEYALKLMVCHLDHGMRGKESARDYDFVEKAAGGLGFEFFGKRLDAGVIKAAGGSVQEAARFIRLGFLEETATKIGAARVALGHTLDDRAETVLMRMIQGSGLDGLSGIRAERDLFVRPLIEVSRAEIECAALERGIEHVFDSSNLSDKYLRNDIRKNLIPVLRERYNPNITETLARTASVLSVDSDFIRLSAQSLWHDSLLERTHSRLVLDRRLLLNAHAALLARVVVTAVGCLCSASDLSSEHIRSFIKVVKGRRPNAELSLPGVRMSREYDRIVLSTCPTETARSFNRTLLIPGRTPVPEAGCVLKASLLKRPPRSFSTDAAIAYFDYDSITLPVLVRPMMPGDRIVPLGMSGRKKLKDIFIEDKVPRGERASVPVLVSGTDLLWAVRSRQSERFKVVASTAVVLKVQCLGPGTGGRTAAKGA